MNHDNFRAMSELLVPFAQQMLAKYGEFYPMGATVDAEGKPAMCGCGTGTDDENPDSVVLIEILLKFFEKEAAKGLIRAAGICFDSRFQAPGMSEKSDAICVQMEQSEGECVQLFIPYRKGFLGRYRFGEIIALPGERRLSFQQFGG